MVNILSELGADLEKTKEQPNNWTPLHFAAYRGCEEVVRTLLEHGANKDQTDNDGDTPLHLAADWGHAEVVRILLQYGADKDQTSNDGDTPLQLAVEGNQFAYRYSQNGHDEVIRLLQ